jgi:chemotaxis protein MotB
MTRTFTHAVRFAGLAFLGVALTGCVSNEKYQAQKLAHDALVEQLADAQRDASSARAEAEAYKNQLTMLGANGNSKDAMLVNLQQQNGDLQRQLEELNRRYEEAVGRLGTTAVLPADLTNVLEEFAQAYPDMVDFDSAKGIVKFKSDVVFDPGSAQVTQNARQAVARFAGILNSPQARGYELMVVGHTDNTRVVNPATIKAGHLDNWHLSAHRAIAVGNEMQRDGVSAERLTVAGCADQRPVASNATTQGKAQNRRVEVLILPNTVRTGVARGNAPARAAAAPTRPAAGAARRADLNKDTAGADPRPTFNK